MTDLPRDILTSSAPDAIAWRAEEFRRRAAPVERAHRAAAPRRAAGMARAALLRVREDLAAAAAPLLERAAEPVRAALRAAALARSRRAPEPAPQRAAARPYAPAQPRRAPQPRARARAPVLVTAPPALGRVAPVHVSAPIGARGGARPKTGPYAGHPSILPQEARTAPAWTMAPDGALRAAAGRIERSHAIGRFWPVPMAERGPGAGRVTWSPVVGGAWARAL